MIRLRRAAREHAIKTAIQILERQGNAKMFTKGEICRKMGIKSTSRVRDILSAMADCGELVYAEWWRVVGQDPIAVYGLPHYEQIPLSIDHEIIINGQSCRMSDMDVKNA